MFCYIYAVFYYNGQKNQIVFGGKGQRTSYSSHIFFDLGSDESTDWGRVMSAIWLTQQRCQSAHSSPAPVSSDVLSRATDSDFFKSLLYKQSPAVTSRCRHTIS